MPAKYHGRYFAIEELRERCFTNETGSSLYTISEAAESYGFKTTGFRCSLKSLISEADLPVIAHWNENHFVVIYKATKNFLYLADPAVGNIKYTHDEFQKGFTGSEQKEGIILALEPSRQFYEQSSAHEEKSRPWAYLWSHLSRYRVFLNQVLLAAFATAILSVLLPLITQPLIDDGVVNGNFYFIKVLLISQLLLFAGKLSFDVLKNWIIIHWSYRVNISVISSFLMDFLGLSANELSRKTSADVLQRIEDYQHVEDFLTNTSINLILSGITFVLFSSLLVFYHLSIFLLFLCGTALSIIWIIIFQPKRKAIYYKLVGLMTQNKSKVIDIIEGMDEVKMYNLERRKRWEWEDVQVKEYQSGLKSLQIEQTQEVGFQAINELKNIAIIFLGALAVMNGQLSLGALLAIAFISGQLNNTLSFVPGVFLLGQEARVSLERLITVSKPTFKKYQLHKRFSTGDLKLEDVSFTYDGHVYALDQVNFTIPKGKTVAIVGGSGSGKTTLLKLLTKFLTPTEGSVKLDGLSLEHLDDTAWRKKIGVVSQDGYIFPDTVLKNIAISSTEPAIKRAILCAKIANIHEDLDDLPGGYYTKIGEGGLNLSKGQKQRILIARAIYKNPDYLFFDEATSALDSVNEKTIQRNLNKIFKNRTVFIIAHRLSTVQHADNIIVLDKGKIVEQGNHNQLIERKGYYFQLVRDQLILSE